MAIAGLYPFSILDSPPHTPNANIVDSLQPRCDPPFLPPPANTLHQLTEPTPVTSNPVGPLVGTVRNAVDHQPVSVPGEERKAVRATGGGDP